VPLAARPLVLSAELRALLPGGADARSSIANTQTAGLRAGQDLTIRRAIAPEGKGIQQC